MNKSTTVEKIDRHDEDCKIHYQACKCKIAKELQDYFTKLINEYEVNRLVKEVENELRINEQS